MESRRIFRRNELVASPCVKEFVLGAALSDAGLPLAEFLVSANARHQSSIRLGVRRDLEASVILVNEEILPDDKIILKDWNRHLSSCSPRNVI